MHARLKKSLRRDLGELIPALLGSPKLILQPVMVQAQLLKGCIHLGYLLHMQALACEAYGLSSST